MSNKRPTRRQRRMVEQETDNILNKKFAMKRISPMTKHQQDLFDSYYHGKNIANVGSAGTGKTYVSLYLAYEDVLNKDEYEKVIIVRSAVQAREQGFMPGKLNEKMENYETPYVDITNDLFDRDDAYQIMKQKGMVQFMSTSFIRGLTWNNCIVIVDEVQNMSYEELRTVITRVGETSKVILCGDTRQDDLRNSKNRSDRSGLSNFLRVITNMNCFDVVEFGIDDIVRSGLVKEFIITEERELEYA